MPAEPAGDGADGSDLDALIERFDRFSGTLVRLEPYPFATVRATVETFAAAVERHVAGEPRGPPVRRPVRSAGVPVTPELLRQEHAWFRTSLEELRGLVDVVARDDHGGHRQALGQYGRLLAEALRRHRRDERGPAAGPASTPGKHN